MTWDSIRKIYTNPYPMEENEEFYGISPLYHPPGFVPFSSSKSSNLKTPFHQDKSTINTVSSGLRSRTPNIQIHKITRKKSPRNALNKSWSGKREFHHHVHKYTSCNCCPKLSQFNNTPQGGRKCDACAKIFGKKRGSTCGQASTHSCTYCSCSHKEKSNNECQCQRMERERKRTVDGFNTEPVSYIFSKSNLPPCSMSLDTKLDSSSHKKPAFDASTSPTSQRYMFEDLLRGVQWNQWRAQLSDPVLENVKQKMIKQNGLDRGQAVYTKDKENVNGGKVYMTYIDYLTKDAPIRYYNSFKSPHFE